MKEDDNNWPEPDRVGRQELEIVMGNEHISFTTSKIGSLVDVQSSKDPEGLRIFYYLVQGGSDVAHDTIDMVVEAVVDLAVHLFGSYLETLIFRRHRGCCCTNAPGLSNAAESPNARHLEDPEDRREEGGHVPANAPNDRREEGGHVPENAPNAPNAHVPANAPEGQPEEGGAVPPNAPNTHDLEDPEDDLQRPEEGGSEPEDDLQQPEEEGSEPEDADDIV